MALQQQTNQGIEPASLLDGLTPRRAWLILRAVVVLGFLGFVWYQGYPLVVLLAVVIFGPLSLLHWLRGGEVEPVRTGAVEDNNIAPGLWDFSESTRQNCDPAYRLEPTNIYHNHKNAWDDYQ